MMVLDNVDPDSGLTQEKDSFGAGMTVFPFEIESGGIVLMKSLIFVSDFLKNQQENNFSLLKIYDNTTKIDKSQCCVEIY